MVRIAKLYGHAAQRPEEEFHKVEHYRFTLEIANWQSLPLATAAQTVQESAFPTRYADGCGAPLSIRSRQNTDESGRRLASPSAWTR